MRWGRVGVMGLALAQLGASGPPPRVERFTPAGSVQALEQVEMRFATAMVPLGDPRAAAPVTARCGAGTGRWVDQRTWAYDFARPLSGGLRCRFQLRDGLTDASGARLTGPRAWSFDTGGPALIASAPSDGGDSAEEDQVFVLALNAPPTAASLAANASCSIAGVGEAVPLDPIPPAELRTILAAADRGEWRLRSLLETAGWREPEYDDGAPPRARAALAGVRCRRTLPAGGGASIVWGAGIATANGLATAVAQRIDVKIRAPFTARFECARVNAAAACSPIEPLRVAFSGRVPVALAARVRLVAAGGSAYAPAAFERAARVVEQVEFAAPLPERTAFRVVLPAALVDDAGRRPVNAARFPLAVATGEAPPLVKFAATFGILEAGEGGVLPVTMRNVEPALGGRVEALGGRALRVAASDGQIAAWLRRLDSAEERTSIEEPIAGSEDKRRVETTRSTPLIPAAAPARALRVPKPEGARAFEVIGIPLGRPGFHIVELASPRLGAALLGRPGPRYVAAGALVTNMAVHFQWGRGRSLAWVTRLSDGAPVPRATVHVTDSCTGRLLWRGPADAQGRATIPAVLPAPEGYGSCESGYGAAPLMVSARAGDDFSFTLTSWNSGIQPGDFNLPQGYGTEPATIHTIFDRTLIRAGETINMKHIARTRSDAGFAFAPDAKEPLTLAIRHLGSDQVYEQPAAMARGAGESRWTAPPGAALGDYQVELGPKSDRRVSGRFSLEEYRLPAMRATVTGPPRLVRPASAPVDLALGYYSGGPAAGAPVTLRTQLEPREIGLADYPGFSFTGDAPVEGVTAAGDERDAATVRAATTPLRLDRRGVARVAVPVAAVTRPSRLVAEMDYDDPNGERLTARGGVDLDPASLRVGIATDGWLMKAGDVRLRLVTLDLDDKPVGGRRVEVALFSRETYSYRKRLIGGFYTYDDTREVKRLAATCAATTDTLGLATCKLDAGVSGEVVATATATDDAGRATIATTSLWLAGDDDWWFGGDNGDRMDLVPERAEYAANGVARLQVRMPFRRATALVTVLRDGVIDSFVTELSGKDPVVEVPMKGAYAPNVYVSVLAVRGRVAGWRLWLADLARRWDLPWISREVARPTALVDLAKPSWRLGVAKLRVGWDARRLAVRVATPATRYEVRALVPALVRVAAPAGRALPADAEIAIAAVDEALLGLKPNDSWELLTAMMTERPLSVLTSTAQSQVVGKRHYGRKAVAAGGGGGASGPPPRADFKPLLLWRGRVPLDAQGRARLRVPLNDALSSFRIVAVATAGADLFGTGHTSVRTTQELQLLAGLPPLVRTGDSYEAVLTVRNGGERALRANVTASAGAAALASKTVDLAPGAARVLAWRVAAPARAGTVPWAFAATAGRAADRLQITQTVIDAVPVTTWAATLVQLDRPQSFPVAPPAGALPGRGGVEIALSRSLAGSLAGVRDWMRAYPYDCLEQRLSKIVALGDRAGWDREMAGLPLNLAADGLLRFFPADWLPGDDALTSHVLTLASETGWPLPADARARMLAGLTGVVEGRVQPGFGDQSQRKVMAIAALARFEAATPAMLDTLTITPEVWATATLADWLVILQRLPAIPGHGAKLAQADSVLRARLDSQGSALTLNRADAAWWLLGSPDATAARVLLTTVDRAEWRDDAGRVARGLVGRQRRGAWDTTVANALGTLALQRFARRFEATLVTGRTVADLGGGATPFDWARAPAPANLAWPAAAAPLTLRHEGAGAPWALVSAKAAVPVTRPFGSGYTVRRTVTAVARAAPGRWTRGDVMRVTIEVASRGDANWTVIDDPVPAGSTILGGSLGGRSAMLAAGEASAGPQPSYVERRADALRAYYAQVPRGRFTYAYTLRLGTAGRFILPPTRVEALYVPGMVSLTPGTTLNITS